MDVHTLKCDECGKLRMEDSNHWMEGFSDGVKVVIAEVGIMTSHDLGGMKGLPKKEHFCGQACAMKWIGVKLAELRG